MNVLQEMLIFVREEKGITPKIIDNIPVCARECIHNNGKTCKITRGLLTPLCEPAIRHVFVGLSNTSWD